MGVLTPQQLQQARGLYQLAIKAGLPPGRAAEFVAAGYAESKLNPSAQGPPVAQYGGRRAAGDFQLLSDGYVNAANAHGGVFNPTANAEAILPAYERYWQAHPGAAAGEGAAAVEASGEGPGFYSAPLSVLHGVLGPAASSPLAPGGFQGGLSLGGRALSLGTGVAGVRDALLQETEQLRQGQPLNVASELQTIQNAGGGAAGAGAGPVPPSAIAASARKYLGVPYKWGGNDPATGLDCSSFVQHVYAEHGITLPRTTTGQFHVGTHVDLNNLQPGDVVFTEPGRGPLGGPGHEALYLGNGLVQESPHTGTVNRVVSLSSVLGGGFAGARRFTGP